MRLISGDVLRPVNRCATALTRTSLIQYLHADSSDPRPAKEGRVIVRLAEADRVKKGATGEVDVRVGVADLRYFPVSYTHLTLPTIYSV